MADDDPYAKWVKTQRDLARTLGLSLEDWMEALDAAGGRRTGLTAAAVGAAMSRGLGMAVISELDGPALATRARQLLDPAPPRAKNPVLREAIRRATDELAKGGGLERLRERREAVRAPRRGGGDLAASDARGTADAPGEDES